MTFLQMHHIPHCLLVLAFSGSAAPENADRDALGVLAEGYSRNRESFDAIDCRFDYAQGKAATIENALAGRFTERFVKQRGHWLVNGRAVLYQLLCAPELREETERIKREDIDRRKSRASGSATPSEYLKVPCLDSEFLRNDSYSLHYAASIRAGNLFSKTDQDGNGIRITPFNVDFLAADEYSNPARYIAEALAGQWDAKFDGTKRINGVDTLVARIGAKLEVTFGFDPARNFLLVYSSYAGAKPGQRYYEAYVTAARECSGGRWFPMRTVLVRNPDRGPPFHVREVTVVEVDVDSTPRADRFRLEVPTGVQVSNVGHVEWITLDHPENVGINDLSLLHQRCVEHGREYEARRKKDEAMFDGAGEPLEQSGSRAALVLACVVFAAGIVWLVVLKRRR